MVSDPIETVQRRDLVGFCQGWIIEDGVTEIFDRPAVIDDGLPDGEC
jgi:hypothetical protein